MNKIVGGVGLAVLAVGGVLWLTAGGEESALKSQEDSAFTEDTIVSGQMVIGATAPEQVETSSTVVVGGLTETGTQSPSSREMERLEGKIIDLEKKLAAAEATISGQDELVKELRGNLKQREEELKELDRNLSSQHAAELQSLRDAYDLEIQALKNQLAVLENIGTGISAEQKRLLEEAEARRRAQIESEGIIFDQTTDQNQPRRY